MEDEESRTVWVGNFDPEEVTQEVLYELFLQVRPGLAYCGGLSPLAGWQGGVGLQGLYWCSRGNTVLAH